MENDWDDMCKDIEQKYNTDMILADIAGNAMAEMNDVYNDIEYVPTIILLKNGKKVKEYNGPKKKDDMIKFLMNEGVLKSSMRGGKKRKTRRRKSVKRRITKRKSLKRKSLKRKKTRKSKKRIQRGSGLTLSRQRVYSHGFFYNRYLPGERLTIKTDDNNSYSGEITNINQNNLIIKVSGNSLLSIPYDEIIGIELDMYKKL